jgi:DNA-binding NtrC family response regulator
MAAILQDYGFEVVTASSAREATDSLTNGKFDVVITDLVMETELAGHAVAEFASQQIPRPAIILFTGYGTAAVNWQDHGAQALIAKPAPVATVLGAIEQLLQSRSTFSIGEKDFGKTA